ncbi:molybdenum cofactor guanylyltransferase [Motilimonas sp. E26]|uniref:molybdenum cofactor guanylyltransferase n=1 Tax=Motilimonas sp. E26 TaxID=2865674 RepID=UPI001E41152E|nr:molybdenum cofactor guanylyltransferase [Motilimonas sp. E26]MCE0558806.1 molybdenum cofactor guanylyltransferase [Motilimonas sp. E26]
MQWPCSDISVIILAGGCSSRMGQDKALLMREGKTQLQHCVELVQHMGFREVKVSGQYQGVSCLPDLHPNTGPLAGIESAFKYAAAANGALLIFPVDMPLLSKAEILALVEGSDQHGAYYSDALFPLLLPLNQALEDCLGEMFNQDDPKKRSLYQLLKRVNCKKITPNPQQRERLGNANTPTQWRQLTQSSEPFT